MGKGRKVARKRLERIWSGGGTFFRFPFLLHENYTLHSILVGLGTEGVQDMQPENMSFVLILS